MRNHSPAPGFPLLLFNSGGAALIDWTNATPAAITPTAGSELLTNGDFSAWTGSVPDGWTVNNASPGVREVTEVGSGESHGGVGTGSVNIWSTTGYVGVYQTPLTANLFYQSVVNVSALVALNVGHGTGFKIALASGLNTAVQRASDSRLELISNGATDSTVDDISTKALSGLASAEAEAIVSSGYGYAHWHIVAGRQAGFDLYAAADGYLRIYVDRVGNKIWLGVYDGAWSWSSAAITYSDTKAAWAYVTPGSDMVMVGYDTPADIESWSGNSAIFDTHDLIKNASVTQAFLDSLDTFRRFSTDATNDPQAMRFKEV